MHRPPPLTNCLSYPITTGIGLSAVIVTLWWWGGANIDKLTIDYRAFQSQPWRLVTYTLPHVNVFHLLFNLYWLWAFGVKIESIFGSKHTFAIMVFLAIGSGVAEYALLSGGVGLSGVGYGLFGLLWVLSRSESRFSDSVDDQIVALFIGWFFLCILFTITNIMPVANVAHGAGAGLGILLGWTIAVKTRKQQIGYRMLSAIVFIAIIAAGSVGRRYVNFTNDVAREESYRAHILAHDAYQAILDKDYERAADLSRQALAIDDKQAEWWFNLGIVYQNLNLKNEAIDSFRRALELSPENEDFKRALESLQDDRHVSRRASRLLLDHFANA